MSDVILDQLPSRDTNSTKTCFFRNPTQINEVLRSVVPRTLPDASKLNVLIIAGSIGCEAISLAITQLENPAAPKLQILTTDRQQAVVDEARRARYRPDLFHPIYGKEGGTTPDVISRWFHEITGPDGPLYEPIPAVRENIFHAAFDVLRDPPPGQFDIVFCQNVLIHMDDPTALIALTRALNCANPKAVFVCAGMNLDLREHIVAAGFHPWPGAVEEIHEGWESHRMHFQVNRGKHYFELEDLDISRAGWLARYASIFVRNGP